MAIMSVNRPEAPREKEKKEDDFDRLIKGLQIAQSITGIATNYHQIQASKLQQQRMEQELKSGEIEDKRQRQLAEGLITPDIERQIFKVPEGTLHARSGKSSVTGETFFYYTPGDIENKKNEALLAFNEAQSKAEKDAKSGKNSQELTQTLSKELRLHPVTKDLDQRYISFRNAEEFLKMNTPASQHSAILNYFKTMDPTSTVREGEVADAKNATNVPERFRNAWNLALEGKPLNDRQMKDLVDVSRSIVRQQLNAYNNVVLPQYLAEGQKYGADINLIGNPSYIELYKTFDKLPEINVQQQPSQNVSGSQSMSIMPQAQAASERDDLSNYIKSIPDQEKPKGIIPLKNAPRR
jgi:hypothetical protein